MQDPTQGVPPQLLAHVHLLSQHKYPLSHQLAIDQAYQCLVDAPKVVKQIAPMHWQYLAGPQDGTVFLTWVGGRMQNSFASDGYVWADQEQRYTQDFGAYTLEIAVHQSGYRPGVDSLSSHMRRRYRFISKIPSVAALPPDPSLWLVHYSQAEPQNCIPTAQVMVPPQVRSQLAERQWIERQGRLEQQAFMLHDREKWPHLSLPGQSGLPGPTYNPSMQNQNPMAHIGNPRFSGQFYQQQAAQQAQVGPSPAKRARQYPPSQMPASAAALMATDTSIEDEENVLYGDILDHLTQRDISLTRYMQHHEWMEEVFSSPYATCKIIPADLGFGLMGELAGLTEGLLDVPSGEEEKTSATNGTEPSYRRVTPEQLSEFEKRVKAHMEKGQAELDRMKEEHAKKMAALRKNKTLVQAEKRLRNAAWDPADTGNEFWRLDRAGVASGDASATSQKESAEHVVKEVEAALGGSIHPQKEASLVERGGLKDKVVAPPPPPPVEEPVANGSIDGMDVGMDGSFDESAQTQDQYGQMTTGFEQTSQPGQTAHEQTQPSPQQQQQQAQTQAQALLQAQQQVHAQAQQQARAQLQQAQQQQQQPQQPQSAQTNTSTPGDASLGNSEAMLDDPSMSLMDDLNMDMDVDVEDINNSSLDFTNAEPSPAPQQQQHQQQPPQQQQTQPQTQSHTQQSSTAPTTSSTNANQTAGIDQDMFTSTSTPAGGDNTFNDFDTGDGLIDFDGGADDLGFGDMDNSAFGDAFHGTEGHGDDGL